MRRKQLAKRVAIAVLSAATVMTSVPATAVFAAEVSIEASDTTATTDNTTVKVVAGSYATDDDVDTLLSTAAGGFNLVEKIKNVEPNKDATGAYSATATSGGEVTKKDLAGQLSDALEGYTISDAEVTDAKAGDYSFTLTEDATNKTYTVTVAAKPAAEKTLPPAIKQELDYYFAQKTFDVYNGASLTTAYIASQAKTELTSSDYKNATTIQSDSYKNAFNITGTTDTISSDGEVTLKVTVGSKDNQKDIDYTASIKLNKINGTQDQAITTAINAVNGKTYAYAGADTIKAKLAKDLEAAGWKGASAANVDLTYTENEETQVKTRDRRVVVSVKPDGKTVDATKVFTITLTKSSKQKLDETEEAIGDGTKGILGTAEEDTKKAVVEKGKDAVGSKSYDLGTNTTISLAAQNINATKAASTDDVVKAVQNAIDAQLTAKKLTDNGVTVEVSAVDETLNSGLKHKDATVGKDGNGYYYVVVKFSVDDDFADWDVESAPKNYTPDYYVVKVETPALKEIKATAVSIDDQNLVFKYSDVYHQEKVTGEDGKETTTGFNYMAIPLKAVLTPADANSTVTYTVTKESGNGAGYIGKEVTKAAEGQTPAETFKVTDSKGNDVTSDSTLYVNGSGVYTVTATANGKSDTATITVKSRFNDTSASAYYTTPVEWAYGNDITSGVSENIFGVNQNVTRGQFVTWLYREAVKADPSVAIKDADVKEVFSDVLTTAYYAKAVQWASENGVASGIGGGKFDPNADVTRAQAITFIYRALGQPDTGASGEEGEETTQFTDVKSGAYYMPAVTWGVNHYYNGQRIVSGTSTSTFGPDQTATRAQGITFIYRAFAESLAQALYQQ